MSIYNLYYADGTLAFASDHSEIVEKHGLKFTGRAIPFNENFLRQLENFASEEDSNNPGNPPTSLIDNPITGQLWFDKTNNVLRIYFNSVWEPLKLDTGDLNTRNFVGGKNSVVVQYPHRSPRAMIFMFTYPSMFAQDTQSFTYNRDDPDFWLRRLVKAIKLNPHVKWTVVANPNSGPGSSIDNAYTTAIEWLRGAGASVIGYISTDWGGPYNPDGIDENSQFYDPYPSIDGYKSEIDTWVDLYPMIEGIWMDELPFYTRNNQSGSPNPEEGDPAFEFYKELSDYVRKEHGLSFVGGNPGQTQFDDRYLYEDVMDLINIFEQESEPGESDLRGDFSFRDNVIRNRPSRLSIMPHNIGLLSQDEVARRVVKNSEWVDWIFYWDDDTYGNGLAWDSDKYAHYVNGVGLGWYWVSMGGVKAGATVDRPSSPTLGFDFFDTDLGHTIWWDGSQWVDSSGTSV